MGFGMLHYVPAVLIGLFGLAIACLIVWKAVDEWVRSPTKLRDIGYGVFCVAGVLVAFRAIDLSLAGNVGGAVGSAIGAVVLIGFCDRVYRGL